MLYPAIHISTDDRELIYAVLDDYTPSAIQERDSGLTEADLEREAAFVRGLEIH